MKKNLLFHASKVKIQTKYNYSNEWQKNITNSKKNNPNFMGYILFYCLSKQKKFKFKFIYDFHIEFKSIRLFCISLKFFRRSSGL